MVETQFNRLLTAIETCFPSVRDVVNSPATIAELAALRDAIETPLPEQLAELLQLSNGQSAATPFVLGGFSFYSTTAMPRMREINNFHNSNPCWIPIGSSEPFELVMDSDPNSVSNGHLFVYDAESGPQPFIAQNLLQYLKFTTDKIIAGDYRKLLQVMMIHHDPINAG